MGVFHELEICRSVTFEFIALCAISCYFVPRYTEICSTNEPIRGHYKCWRDVMRSITVPSYASKDGNYLISWECGEDRCVCWRQVLLQKWEAYSRHVKWWIRSLRGELFWESIELSEHFLLDNSGRWNIFLWSSKRKSLLYMVNVMVTDVQVTLGSQGVSNDCIDQTLLEYSWYRVKKALNMFWALEIMLLELWLQ